MVKKGRALSQIGSVELTRVGDENSELKYVQDFLTKFGYLEKSSFKKNQLDTNTSNALKKYQEFNNIEITGDFNDETRSIMQLSRCGLSDIQDSDNLSFSVRCGWNKKQIHYTIGNVTNDVPKADAIQAIKNAFNTWENASSITFIEVLPNENPDILVEWREAIEDDYDMSGNVLAHADFPLDCSIITDKFPLPLHFDDTEHSWCIGAFVNQFDIETIALHEIGHILGLQHSNVQGSVMYSSVSSNFIKRNLTQDDISGIESLYVNSPNITDTEVLINDTLWNKVNNEDKIKIQQGLKEIGILKEEQIIKGSKLKGYSENDELLNLSFSVSDILKNPCKSLCDVTAGAAIEWCTTNIKNDTGLTACLVAVEAGYKLCKDRC